MAFNRSLHRLAGLGALLLLAGCAAPGFTVQGPSPAEIPALEEQATESPSDAGVLLRLGAAYREAGRTDEALRTLQRARELAPEEPAVLFFLGLTAEEGEEWPTAGAAYRAFLETDADRELLEHVRSRMPLVRRQELLAETRASLAREQELVGRAPAAGTVAVFPFRYVGPDPDLEPLGRAMAELTVTDLASTGRLALLERLRVQLLLDELELAAEGLVDPSTAARSGRILGAEQIVQATISGNQDRVDVLAAVVPVTEGAPRDPVAEEDALDELYELQKRMVLALHASLGVELTEAERERILERRTHSLSALLLFGRALEAEDRGDFEEAEELHEQALAEDPDFEAAREGRDRSAGAARGSRTSSGELAQAGAPHLPPPASEPADPLAEILAVESMIPTPGDRDPSAELLGNEGVRPSAAVIEIILRAPGGGQ